MAGFKFIETESQLNLEPEMSKKLLSVNIFVYNLLT